MAKYKRVVYEVQCAFNPEHIFEKVIEVEEGGKPTQTEIDAYCPFCENYTRVTIQGEIGPDDILLEAEPDFPEDNTI
jgi:hypothetical protein